MRDLKLGPKFTIILLIVFLLAIVLSGMALWQGLQGRAEAEVADKALLLIQMAKSVRDYTTHNIQPLLNDELDVSPSFISEFVPAYSARSVFANFRGLNPSNGSYFYKEAASNPTNPDHRADPVETEVLTRLRGDPTVRNVSGFRQLNDRLVYYTAFPLSVTDESCLRCHSDPSQAPKSMVALWGEKNGFGWQLHDVVAAQMIYVPAQDVFDAAMRPFVLVMAIYIVLLALVLFLVNYLLRREVIRPAAVLAGLARKIAADKMTASDLESPELVGIVQRRDELGESAGVFQQMARQVAARADQLKRQVQDLRIEIDEARRRQNVARVVDTDFFQNLKTRAQELRSEREKDDDLAEHDADADDAGAGSDADE